MKHKHNWQLIGGDYSYVPKEDGKMEYTIHFAVFVCECGEYKVNDKKVIKKNETN